MPQSSIDNPAVPFSTVLESELEAIAQARGNRGPASPVPDGDDPFQKARDMKLAGLAFSGGGIRSATINLGILQGLANYKMLRHIDYLSTVSGGGYIGSWLSAWINRTNGDVKQVETYLSPEDSRFPDSPGQGPIHHLRQFSNYLTPNLSIFQADTWSVWAIWSRNTLLNLLILVAGMAALLILPRLLGLSLFPGASMPAIPSIGAFGIPAGLMLLLATILIGRNLNAVRAREPKHWYGQPVWVQLGIVVPSFIAAVLLTCWLRWTPEDFSTSAGILKDVWRPTVAFIALFAVIQYWGDFQQCFIGQHKETAGWQAAGVLLQIGIAVLSAFVTALMLRGVAQASIAIANRDDYAWSLLTFGPPVIMLLFALGVIVQIGLMGHDLPDESREWLGTLRAWMMIYSAGWLIFFVASLFGPFWIASIGGWHGWAGLGISGTWVTTSLGGLLAGKNSSTNGAGKQPGKEPPNPWAERLAQIAPYVFMVGFVLAIAFGVHQIVTHDAPGRPMQSGLPFLQNVHDTYWEYLQLSMPYVPFDSPRWWLSGLVTLLGIAIVITLLMSWRVDINDFSLNHFYKNRLVRCYLGASRERRPNLLTGFDPDDDLYLAKLDDPAYGGPYHIINATLNLSSGRNLALQERMGASYIFTPRYSGYDTGVDDYQEGGKMADPLQKNQSNRRMRIGMNYDIRDPKVRNYAYRKTELSAYTGGIHIGSAVAISGAAANPNDGYHTSTPVAFMMTVFNVRLGWWLGNPRLDRYVGSSGPAVGLLYTIKELFGMTDASSGYVNLSDGGHFENLGIYELVRRRCRYIVSCDGEQDLSLTFGGLAGAIRKCRTDFGVEIEIVLDRIAKDGPWSGIHCVMGKILYPERENDDDHGYLLYLKSSLTGDEPEDVREYQTREPDFPQQTTADQWFDESQFESYRRLGLHIADTVFQNRQGEIERGLEGLFAGLELKWS